MIETGSIISFRLRVCRARHLYIKKRLWLTKNYFITRRCFYMTKVTRNLQLCPVFRYNFCLRIDNMIYFFICYSVRSQTSFRTAALSRLDFTYRRQRRYMWNEPPMLRHSMQNYSFFQIMCWTSSCFNRLPNQIWQPLRQKTCLVSNQIEHCMFSFYNFLHRNFAFLRGKFNFSTLKISFLHLRFYISWLQISCMPCQNVFFLLYHFSFHYKVYFNF